MVAGESLVLIVSLKEGGTNFSTDLLLNCVFFLSRPFFHLSFFKLFLLFRIVSESIFITQTPFLLFFCFFFFGRVVVVVVSFLTRGGDLNVTF